MTGASRRGGTDQPPGDAEVAAPGPDAAAVAAGHASVERSPMALSSVAASPVAVTPAAGWLSEVKAAECSPA